MSNQKPKKILTIEDLVQFCQTQNFNKFSSRNTGYQLSVQVPASFEVAKENNDDTLLFCKVKCFHIGINRNQSSVTKAAAEKAMKTMAYKPILADFCTIIDEDGNEVRDFTSHTMEIDDDGNVNYIERQIGAFTADEPYIEHDDEVNKDFIFAIAAIPREYTDAASIIERKNGTKVSVELLINEMEYSAKDRVLELTDITVQGLTCLGTDPNTGKQVEEGMKNSRLDIIDFSQDNNSIVDKINVNKETNQKLIETLDKLNNTLSKFNINQAEISADENSKEGGNIEVSKFFEELLAKYNKTESDIEFEVEGLSDEELESKFAEVFGEVSNEEDPASEEGENFDETDESEETESEGSEESESEESDGIEDFKKKKKCEEESEESEDNEDEEDEENSDDTELTETEACGKKKKCSISVDEVERTFELSLDDIQYALYSLVNDIYSEADNTYYGVTVYDTYVVMHDWWNGRNFKQSFAREDDNFSLVGDRVEVYTNWLTKEEEESLAELRSNYAALVQYKEDMENAQLHSQREEILNNEKYSVLAEKDENNEYKNEAYAKLVSEMDNYSLTDLEKELKSVFADYITNGGQFAYNNEVETKPSVSKKLFAKSTEKKPSRYGNLFNK